MTVSDIKQGDYVRITIEGPWVGDDTTDGEQFDGDVQEYVNEPTDRVFLTKIEPPVEVFKPGDRLRRNGFGGYEITLGTQGYLQHFPLSGESCYTEYGADPDDFFNSKNFEKVYPG